MHWDNPFCQALRIAELEHIPSQTPGLHGAYVSAAEFSAPECVLFNHSFADELSLQEPAANSRFWVGADLPYGMTPFAMRYGGHQFGQWAGQLGDGRAINLGRFNGGAVSQWFQLKGAGLTAYSRTADGMAVLRSSIREYICSEAMHGLGVPTTRAISLAVTGDRVIRDKFYNGNALPEPGAVVCRVSPSFLRFGSIEIFVAFGEPEQARELLDYLIQYHYPSLTQAASPATELFEQLCAGTAYLVAKWQSLGFVHGVMNTDNMSLIGETIDYGPFGWIDWPDDDFTPNTSDRAGRYAYGQQAAVARWNLMCLASALVHLGGDRDRLIAALEGFEGQFQAAYEQEMSRKLGLAVANSSQVSAFDALCREHKLDWTRTLALLEYRTDHEDLSSQIASCSYASTPSTEAAIAAFVDQWRAASPSFEQATNPVFIPRNYVIQQAIDPAEQGDYAVLRELAEAVVAPTAISLDHPWAAIVPKDDNAVRCNQLSCSS